MRRRIGWTLGITVLVLATVGGAWIQGGRPRFHFIHEIDRVRIEYDATSGIYSEVYYLPIQASNLARTAHAELEANHWQESYKNPKWTLAYDGHVSWENPATTTDQITFETYSDLESPMFSTGVSLSAITAPKNLPPKGTRGIITVQRRAGIFDRFRAWLWHRTHP